MPCKGACTEWTNSVAARIVESSGLSWDRVWRVVIGLPLPTSSMRLFVPDRLLFFTLTIYRSELLTINFQQLNYKEDNLGTLRTLGWMGINHEEELREIVIPLSNVAFAMDYEDGTSLLSLKPTNVKLTATIIQVDLSIGQVEHILHRHEINPRKSQRTHGLGKHPVIEEQTPNKPQKKVKK